MNRRHRPPSLRSLSALILAVIIITPPLSLHAQTDDPLPDAVERIIEESANPSDDAPDDPGYLDELETYRATPIDLRATTADILARLPGISLADAAEILDYVRRSSPSRIDELMAIPSMTPRKLQILRIFTTLGRGPKAPPPPHLRIDVRSRVVHDLQRRRGYRDTVDQVSPHLDAGGDSLGLDTIPIGHSYLGSRQGYLERVLISYGSYAAGITFEKDPGEPVFYADTLVHGYGRQIYTDPRAPTGPIERRFGAFISGHATARLGAITLFAGDYALAFGEGLLFGGSFGGFKGGEATKGPFANIGGIAPYRSSGETQFYRGGAIELPEDGWLPEGMSARLFLSSRTLDASMEPGQENETSDVVTSLRDDGYRRTRSELRQSGNLEERLAGLNISQRVRHGSIGLTAYGATYSRPFAADLPDAFSGSSLAMVSIDGDYGIGPSTILGEIGRDDDGTIAATGGIITKLPGVELAIAGRYLPPGFHTPHGRSFGEAPMRPHNEMGLYIGTSSQITPELLLDAYLDLYRIPERSATVPFPRSGADGYLQLDYAPMRGVALYARIRRETRGDAATLADSLGIERRRMIDVTATGGRFEAEYSTPGEKVRLRGRFERRLVGYSAGLPASDGMMMFVDLRCDLTRTLTGGARLALFDTDDFASAIRELEGDLPGRFAIPTLWGEGRRFYLYARWRPLPALSIAAKYAETVYTDRDTISPGGTQEIAGRVASSIALQVDLRIGK